jgi:hypothetical protein
MAQRLEPAPAVVGLERDAEEVAGLAVEVAGARLPVLDDAHVHVRQASQAVRQ